MRRFLPVATALSVLVAGVCVAQLTIFPAPSGKNALSKGLLNSPVVTNDAGSPPPTPTPTATPTPTPQELTNAQKLSLDPSTPVATRVSVTDGFVASGAGTTDANHFWFPYAVDEDGKHHYTVTGWNLQGFDDVFWSTSGTPHWHYETSAGFAYSSTEDVLNPWQVVTWDVEMLGTAPPPTLTNPVVQQLASPDETTKVMFVSGNVDSGPDRVKGLYFGNGSLNGRPKFDLIGLGGANVIRWSGSAWEIYDDNIYGAVLFQSEDDVATPDLATTWVAVGDGGEHIPSVSSISAGLAAAGFTISGSSVSANNDTYAIDTNQSGKQSYKGLTNGVSIKWTGTAWLTEAEDMGSLNDTATPIGATFDTGAGVTRNDVASEANWVVP